MTRAKPPGKRVISPRGEITPKEAAGIKKDQRSRFGQLAGLGMDKVEKIGRNLLAQGKDATTKAILSEAKEGEIMKKRSSFEARRDRGAKVSDLAAPGHLKSEPWFCPRRGERSTN